MIRRQIGPTTRVWLAFVAAGTILGAVIAGAVSLAAPSGYTARVTVLVTPTPSGSTVTSSDLQIAQAYIPTLAELSTIRPVLSKVVSSTGIAIDVQDLANSITTHVPAGTSLLTIAVSNPDAAHAASLANAIATELRSFLPEEGSDASGNLKLVLTVVDPATPPTLRDGPSLPVRVALGGAIALFLAISLAFVVENAGRGAQNLGRGIERLGRRPSDMASPTAARPMASPPEPASSLFRTSQQRPWTQPDRAPEPMAAPVSTTFPAPSPAPAAPAFESEPAWAVRGLQPSSISTGSVVPTSPTVARVATGPAAGGTAPSATVPAAEAATSTAEAAEPDVEPATGLDGADPKRGRSATRSASGSRTGGTGASRKRRSAADPG